MSKEHKEFVKNITIHFIILEVLAGVGAVALAFFFTRDKTISIIIGIATSAWFVRILIPVLDILKAQSKDIK